MGSKADLETPVGRRHIIERPRLTRLLDETSARVIMLVAPAGYGKTTLARQWLANRPHAWCEASTGSADVAALALNLASAASTMCPTPSRNVADWLRSTPEPERQVKVAARFLGEHFNEWPDDGVLAIDDYHCLTSAASEELVALMLVDAGVRLLITSRRRPKWATPRRLLYGEISEVGQSLLAMSYEEAAAVLPLGHDDAAGALVALANGWPAVIGLAAFTDISSLLAEDALPTELHEYVAEELYASVEPETQTGLCELSLLPVINQRTAAELIAGPARRVIESGVRAGFLTQRENDAYELHPLLRAFLLEKFEALDSSLQNQPVGRAFKILVRSAAWEEAFSLIDRFRKHDLIEQLVTAALEGLVQQGRVETLRQWIQTAEANNFKSPVFDLLEAECAFRQGHHERARALALRAGDALDPNSPLASKAFYRAGQNAHLTDSPQDAIDSFHRAREVAQTSADARNAIWGAFITNVELERPEANQLLDEFVVASTRSVDDVLRIHNGRLLLGTRFGPLDEAISHARPMTTLVRDAEDPIVRISFWHVLAAAFKLTARYEEAREAVGQGLKESRAYAVDFAQPHMLLTQAGAAIGARRFSEASGILDRVQKLSEKQADEYLTMSTRAMRCRLLLAEGSPEAALAATSGSLLRVSSKGQKSEFLASRSLAYARIGDLDRAQELLAEADGLSGELEAVSLCRWTRVLLGLQVEDASSEEAVNDAFEETVRSGMLDMFVFAYRLDTRVLSVLAARPSLQEILSEVLTRALDRSIAREAKFSLLPVQRDSSLLGALTVREQDVYELLREGRSNKQIAQALVLSEVTVKVHVSNILRKLDVSTRTEAAVLSTRQGLIGH